MKASKTWRVALLAGALCVIVATAAFAGNIGDMFKEIVGKAVVQTAAQKIAKDIKAAKGRDGKLESSSNTMYALIQSYETVLVATWGENAWDKMSCARSNWDSEMGTEEKQLLRNWRETLFKDGRAFLQNPTALWETYQAFKPSVIEGIRKTQAEAEVREYLVGIAKYFTNSEDARSIMERFLKTSDSSEVDRLDWYAYQFAERRRVEGGSELVKAYRQIIEDLAASLQ